MCHGITEFGRIAFYFILLLRERSMCPNAGCSESRPVRYLTDLRMERPKPAIPVFNHPYRK